MERFGSGDFLRGIHKYALHVSENRIDRVEVDFLPGCFIDDAKRCLLFLSFKYDCLVEAEWGEGSGEILRVDFSER